MIKTLILVRHSKPENRHGLLNDFDRALTNEGKSDTIRMAETLQKSGIIPEFILTSSAARAYQTALIFREVFKIDLKSFQATRNLYYGTAKQLLDQIYGMPAKISSLLIVSHNPGISELSRALSDGRSLFMENTQVTCLTYNIDHWYQVGDLKPTKYATFSIKEID